MNSLLESNVIFRNVYCFWAANPGNAEQCTPVGAVAVKDGLLPGGLEWLAYVMAGLSVILLIVNVYLVFAALYTYVDRRVLAKFQGRIGPNRVGPFGILQPLADGIKLMTKEDLVPAGADRWIFNLAPVVMMSSGILVLAVLPFGKDSFVVDLNIGILYVFAITGVNTLAMFMAGLASANRYAMFGGMRAVAQLISYEIPVVLSVVGIVMMAGTMSLVGIVEAQKVPFIFVQPLAFFVFIAGSSAEMNRSPFDQVEAEGEIIAGYHTEYSGMKFGVFQAAEFGAVLITSALIATLFLKGWEGPFLPSHVWFLLKLFFFAFIFIWIRATLPRLRIDQIMAYAWKFLLPLSLINIFVVAAEVLLLGDQITDSSGVSMDLTTSDMWIMAGINVVVAIVAVIGLAKITGMDARESTKVANVTRVIKGT
ncbi:MAG: NADH-quinone oxidoreductase subunit H [Chloroflexi bacterium]|jgi:NADH-quinone oxidoreductase subunit H|nr:MAG: NADH-quinone oxidoreductase subunit H [Chloroflexota bacterium]